jgi:GNAT superfamily N-acetyltransferase
VRGREVAVGGPLPGDIGAIVALHGDFYARNWGFPSAFEAKVAHEFGAFAIAHDADLDLILVARDADGPVGSIVIDHTVTGEGGAHLRWFILAERAQGRGLGRQLLSRALAFCDGRGYDPVWLTTFRGLDAARRLYEGAGFRLVAESTVDQWQGGVTEQRFERPARR